MSHLKWVRGGKDLLGAPGGSVECRYVGGREELSRETGSVRLKPDPTVNWSGSGEGRRCVRGF